METHTRTRLVAGSAALLLGIVDGAAWAQCEPGWVETPGFHYRGVDGNVTASAVWDPDGAGPEPERLAIGGIFTAVQDTPAACVATWDGESWDPMGGGVFEGRIFEIVSALAVYDGMLVVGGHFGRAGEELVQNIAAWDGESWHDLGGGVFGGFPEPTVTCMAVYDGRLVVGGAFLETGSGPANFIAAWDGSVWTPLGAGADFQVEALEVHGGDLYVGGHFSSAGNKGQTAHLARWDGADWHSVGGGTNASVLDLCSHGGELFVGGNFLLAGGMPMNFVARWTATGWQTVGTGTSGSVFSFEVFQGELYAGGLFQVAGGKVVNNIARWDGAWHELDGGTTGGNARVITLTAHGDRLFAGGAFRAAGEQAVDAMALWDDAGWAAFSGRPLNVEAGKLAVFEGGVAMSAFSDFGDGQRTPSVVRWDGLEWSRIGGAFDDQVWDVVVHDGDLYAMGWFRAVDGNTAKGVARWDGAAWRGLGTGIDGGYVTSVLSMATYGGDLIVAGDFELAGGQQAQCVARWDGSAWHGLGGGIDGGLPFVWALVPYGDDLVAAGSFELADGVAANNVARWDGSGWSALGLGVGGGFVPEVLAATVFEGDLIVAGDFTLADGKQVANIARWDGAEWHPMGAGLPGKPVTSLAVYDGRLHAGVGFVFNQTDDRLFRWDGAAWESLGGGLNSSIIDLAPLGSELVLSGAFSVAGDTVAPGMARWTETHAPWFARQPEPVDACLGAEAQLGAALAAGYEGASLRWRRDGVPLSDGPTGHGSVISGATTGTLTISGVRIGDAGEYDVEAGGACASAASEPAALGVCAADFDCSDSVNTLDVLAFLNAWTADDPLADLDGDGDTDTLDVLEFLNAWAAGC